ncbi:GGDEF domain-containing protein [Pseudomonas citronellolis]|uniref:GGDEF domain-containing protein n=1 Tax=Pseudomonas citronellolis TaxID=53408 RepID=UPI0023E44F04|nr:GGDEF domain-containing protein [Pseudomonas citronellolis]MDF3933888.1 GGDEF domain-containing protein [Pseudomonas citronellolis]
MTNLLKLHRLKLLALVVLANCGLLLYLAVGDLKPWARIDWLDVVGEGGSSLLAFCWVCLVLAHRPAGRVTTLLTLGLGAVFFSMWMDALDEFIQLPTDIDWDHWLESVPMPIGLLLITYGLYHWSQEQQALTQQLSKRERLFREHLHHDRLTPLNGAAYLRRQIELEQRRAAEQEQAFSLVLVDLDDFALFNRDHGHAEGDRALQSVSQLLLLNLRHSDLLCRLAGDRFVALLPGTGEAQAWRIAGELEAAVRSYAHKSVPQGESLRLSLSAVACMAREESVDGLLERLNLAMARAKQLPRLANSA